MSSKSSNPKGEIPEGFILPGYLPSSAIDESLLTEIARKRDSRIVSKVSELDEIVKISFICTCHASIMCFFRDNESEKYDKHRTLTTPISIHGTYSEPSISETPWLYSFTNYSCEIYDKSGTSFRI